MAKYAELTTSSLIELLFKDEDRVKRAQIDELIRRGEEAAAPLREFLRNEDYWYEGTGGTHYIIVHAIIALSAMRDEQALPILIEMTPHAYFSDHDSAIEVMPASLANFGEAAVEPLINSIKEDRGAYDDNPDFAQCRRDFSAALTRIALDDKNLHGRIAEFICGNFTDPAEDDYLFLSYSAGHPVALADERGVEALRAAFDRGVINEAITGKFAEFLELLNHPESNVYDDLESDLYDFYLPAMLRARQQERAERKEEKLYWSDEPARSEKVGRNEPCPCGSGKKHKKCCG